MSTKCSTARCEGCGCQFLTDDPLGPYHCDTCVDIAYVREWGSRAAHFGFPSIETYLRWLGICTLCARKYVAGDSLADRNYEAARRWLEKHGKTPLPKNLTLELQKICWIRHHDAQSRTP